MDLSELLRANSIDKCFLQSMRIDVGKRQLTWLVGGRHDLNFAVVIHYFSCFLSCLFENSAGHQIDIQSVIEFFRFKKNESSFSISTDPIDDTLVHIAVHCIAQKRFCRHRLQKSDCTNDTWTYQEYMTDDIRSVTLSLTCEGDLSNINITAMKSITHRIDVVGNIFKVES